MSGYFGALMRSSGMAVGGGAPALAAPDGEIGAERSSSIPTPASAPAASAPHRVSAPIPRGDPVPPLASTLPATANSATAAVSEAPGRLAIPVQTLPAAAADAGADPPSARPTTPGSPKPALGQTLVRAAMQWVAADPQQGPGVAQVVTPPARSAPAVTEDTPASTAPRTPREAGAASAAPAPITTPADLATPAEPASREPVPQVARPTRSAWPVPDAPSAGDAVAEISIGAIHVRVDAPAAQTVARPAPVPPAGQPRTAAFAPRSALSRRALRRI